MVIRYQACGACGRVQYFRRDFCAACGATELADQAASGEGTVLRDLAGRTRRDAGGRRAHVPYNIVLVGTIEGFA